MLLRHSTSRRSLSTDVEMVTDWASSLDDFSTPPPTAGRLAKHKRHDSEPSVSTASLLELF